MQNARKNDIQDKRVGGKPCHPDANHPFARCVLHTDAAAAPAVECADDYHRIERPDSTTVTGESGAEEVVSQEETRELAEKILDQIASTDAESSFDLRADPNTNSNAASNGSGDASEIAAYAETDGDYSAMAEPAGAVETGDAPEMGDDLGADEGAGAMRLKR